MGVEYLDSAWFGFANTHTHNTYGIKFRAKTLNSFEGNLNKSY